MDISLSPKACLSIYPRSFTCDVRFRSAYRRTQSWLIEGKSVPNIGSRGRTTASLSWTERSKKIDVSLGSQTLEDMEARVSDLDRFHIDCQIVFPTMFLAAVAEDVKLEGALLHAYNTYA